MSKLLINKIASAIYLYDEEEYSYAQRLAESIFKKVEESLLRNLKKHLPDDVWRVVKNTLDEQK